MKTRSAKIQLNENDIVTSRIMIALSATFLGLLFLLVLDRVLGLGRYAAVTYVVGAFALAALAFGVLLGIRRGQEHVNEAHRVVRSFDIILASAVVFVSMVISVLGGASVANFLYLLYFMVGLLYLVYYIYRRELFYAVLAASIGVTGLYFLPRLIPVIGKPVALALPLFFLLLVALLAVLSLFNKKNKGFVSLGGKSFRILSADSAGIPVWVMAAAAVAALIVAAVLPSYGLYAILALGGLTLGFGVFYTVRMI